MRGRPPFDLRSKDRPPSENERASEAKPSAATRFLGQKTGVQCDNPATRGPADIAGCISNRRIC